MNANELLETTIRPVLQRMDMWSRSAEKLLLMTACHESMGFRYKEQLGGGPARSYYQIEPDTLKDCYVNYLQYRPERKGLLNHFYPGDVSLEEALLDDRYATAAARMIYARIAEPLPPADDEVNLARYWKTHWNTPLGKGTQTRFLQDWEEYKPEGYE